MKSVTYPNKITVVLALSVFFTQPSYGQTPVATSSTCSTDPSALDRDIQNVSANYTRQFEQRRQNVEREAQQIRSDAPNPNQVEAALNFEFDVSWTEQKIGLDVPEFTMERRRMIFGLPRFEMRDQAWIYHTPSVRMRLQCTPGLPETVCRMEQRCAFGICTDVPVCSTRAGREMCAHIPEIFMQEQRTILSIPEVTGMQNVEIILDLPAVDMKRQDWIVNLPQFTLRNIRAEASQAQTRGQELQQREEAAASALRTSMNSEIKSVSEARTNELFNCQEINIRQSMEASGRDLDLNIRAVNEGLRSATSLGAKTMEDSMRAALAQLTRARAELDGQLSAALIQLNSARAAALNKIQISSN